MSAPAVAESGATSGGEVDLPFRFAQRAFAALLDETGREGAEAPGAFRSAQLRSAARRTLSALSADDQSRLQRWLALQWVSRELQQPGRPGGSLVRVEPAFEAGVGVALAGAREALRARGDGAAAAA